MKLVVRTADLAPLIRRWQTRYSADHPQPDKPVVGLGTGKGWARKEGVVLPLTSIEALQARTEQAGHRVHTDTIYRILGKRLEWVDYWRTADPIMQAIGAVPSDVPIYRIAGGQHVLDELSEAAA